MLIDLIIIPLNQQAGIGSIHISIDDRMVWFEQTIDEGMPACYVHCGNSAYLVDYDNYMDNMNIVRKANNGPLLASSSVG